MSIPKCPYGFVQGEPGWTLKGNATLLGPRGSGAFPSLSEAAIWAKFLGAQCGGIKHDPKYGFVLVHGHEFIETADEVGMCWSKGPNHLPEPAYPFTERGYARFRKEVAQEEANGRVFSDTFKSKFIKEGWRKIGRDHFSDQLEEVYTKATRPGWVKSASTRGLNLGSKIVSVAGGAMDKATEVYSRFREWEMWRSVEEIDSGWVEVPEDIESL